MLEFGLSFLFIFVAICFWLIGWPWLKIQLFSNRPLFWPWVVIFSYVCKPFLTWRMRQRFSNLQLKYNLADFWLAELWLSQKIIIASSIALLFGFIALYLNLVTRFVILLAVFGAVIGFLLPEAKLRRNHNKTKLKMQAELPFMLDLLTLCVQAGLSLSMALQRVAQYSPAGPLRDSLLAARNLERTGMDRAGWLNHWANNSGLDGLRDLVMALNQADKLGMNLGPVLLSQAEQQRSYRFLRAEKLALQAPVKMLMPMVLCIFPCTFMIIGFPIFIKLMDFGF